MALAEPPLEHPFDQTQTENAGRLNAFVAISSLHRRRLHHHRRRRLSTS